MPARPFIPAAIALGLALGTSGRPARAAGAANERTVAVIAFDLESALSEARSAIVEGITRGLESASFIAAPGKSLFVEQGGAPACADPGCFAALGERLGVGFFASADIKSGADAFSVTVVITRAADGRELARHSLTCASLDPCAPVPESARATTREAARKALGVLSTELAAHAESGARLANKHQTPVSAINGGEGETSATETHAGGISAWWFAASSTVAAVAMGTGIFLLAIRGDEADCSAGGQAQRCFALHDDLWLGLGTAAGGAALAVVSAVGYFRWADRGETRLAITPGGVALARRF